MPQMSDANPTDSDSTSCVAMAWRSVLTFSDQNVQFQKILLKNPKPASATLMRAVIMVLFILKSIIIHKEYTY